MEIQVFYEKLWKCMLAWWRFLLFGGHQTDFNICTMLNLMSNSFFSWVFMKLHENLVKYVLFGGYKKGFAHQPVEFGVKLRFLFKICAITWKIGWNRFYLVATIWVLFPHLLNLVSNLCKLHEKMVEICPICWPLYVFWLPLMYWIKSKIKSSELIKCVIWIFELKGGVEIKLVCSNTHIIFMHLWWLLLFLCYKVELW